MAFEKTGVKFIAKGIRKYLRSFSDANKAFNKHNKAIKEMRQMHERAQKEQREFAEALALLAKDLSPKELKEAISDYGKLASKTKALARVLKELREASKETGLSGFVNKLKSVISTIGNVVGGVIRFGRAIMNVLGKALRFVLTPLRLFVQSLRRMLEVAGGILIRDALRRLTTLIRDLGEAVVTSAANFEQLEIRMQNMIARQIRLSGQVEGAAEAFEASVDPARRMLKWVQQLALVAPIDPEAITRILSLALTMNQTGEEARSLTKEILRFTAGMGFTSEIAERIVINLLQMARQGKITTRELRDMARGAMVPTNDILEEMGKTLGITGEEWDQFQKDVAKGRISVDEFKEAFQRVVARDFPQAFERMGKTLQGSIQRLKSFAKTVIGWEVLSPVIKEIGKLIDGFVKQLSSDEVINNAAAIGEVLRKSFLVVKEAISGLLDALGGLADAFGIAQDPARALAQTIITIAAFMKVSVERITGLVQNLTANVEEEFEESSKSAFEWGKNIIVSLAKGIAAVTRVVLRAIASVGRLLKAWFGPGSPPKVAPNLDDWGASAMTEFLKGFLKADFSVFNEISNVIEGFIRSLPTDILAEKELIPSIIGSREVVAQVLDQLKEVGRVTENMVNRIVGSIPNATNAFREYVRVTLELADAQSELDEARKEQEQLQGEINEINEKYGDILDDLNRKLQRNMQVFQDQNKLKKINAALSSGLLTEEEKARLEAEKRDIQLREQIRNVEDQKEAELEAKEERLEAVSEEVKEAQARVDSLTDQKEAQEALIKAQTEHNNLLKEHRSILKSLADAAEDATKKALKATAEIDLSKLDEQIPEFDFEGMFADAETRINEVFDSVGKQFEGLGEDIENIRTAWSGIFGEEGSFGQKVNNIVGFVSRLINWIKILGKVIAGLVGIPLGIITAFVGAGVGLFAALIEQGRKLTESFRNIVKFLKSGQILNAVVSLFNLVMEAIFTPLELIKGAVQGFIWTIIGFFKELWMKLVGGSIIPEMMQAIKLTIFGGLDAIANKFITIKDNVITTVSNMASKVKGVITSSFESAKSKARSIASSIRGIWKNLKGRLVDNSIIPDMMAGIEKSIVGGMKKSEESMRQWSRTALEQTRIASGGVADSISIVQAQIQQTVPTAAVSQPAGVTNNKTTNVTVNANYQRQQSLADVNMDVQAALMASQM